ncbi:MAG: aminoacyl-tRNA hydrolase [Pirellulaceae bacterium]
MKLVVGLGNPGRQYAETRHNVGFMVAAKLAGMVGGSPPRTRFDGELAEGMVDGEKVVVLCPNTFMNASGKSVRKTVDFYKLAPTDVLVVCDDMNLPIGRLRIRAKGSAGGQKGLADIIRHLQSEEIPRLRIGIDPPPTGWAVPDYVLSKFKRSEQAEVEGATERAAYAAIDWVRHDMEYCMNQYNAK